MAVEAPRPWTNASGLLSPPPAPVGERDRVPTGVSDFDHLSGGIPPGSVVLLWGEAGAGHQEFALTSAAHLMLFCDDPELHKLYLGPSRAPHRNLRGVAYVSTSRSKAQVLEEVDAAFDAEYRAVLARHLVFHDLSPSYFSDSVVPGAWAAPPTSLLAGTAAPRSGGGPLAALADATEADGAGRLVIVDSLTDLLVRRSVDVEELVTLVKGLRRHAKSWGGLVYLLLTQGVVAASTEQSIIDSVDGVLAFRWQSSAHHSYRQRSMTIEKFLPVLARIPADQLGRFVIKVSRSSGLVTTQYERI